MHRANDKRQTDERQHQDNRQRRVGRLDPKRHEPLPEPAVFHVEACIDQSGNGSGKGERQIDQGIAQAFEGELISRQHPGDQQSLRDIEPRRGKRHFHGEQIGRSCTITPGCAPELIDRECRRLAAARCQRQEDQGAEKKDRIAERQREPRQHAAVGIRHHAIPSVSTNLLDLPDAQCASIARRATRASARNGRHRRSCPCAAHDGGCNGRSIVRRLVPSIHGNIRFTAHSTLPRCRQSSIRRMHCGLSSCLVPEVVVATSPSCQQVSDRRRRCCRRTVAALLPNPWRSS